MRINKFLALAMGTSRRAADAAVASGSVVVNGQPAQLGQAVSAADEITYAGRRLDFRSVDKATITIVFNKPTGYVVSRNGQGSPTVYDLLPPEHHTLKPVGRLDKDSSGLLVLTNDGRLAHELTHPSRRKAKVYEITLNKPLQLLHRQLLSDQGIMLDDGVSRLELASLREGDETAWQVTMYEGRNRQIRRTFAALGYNVNKLHRIQFGPYYLSGLAPGEYQRQ